MPQRATVAALLVILALPPVLLAQEPPSGWHQLGGPTRNFQVDSAPLADTWPDGGPPTLWTRPLGEGYSSIVVDGDLLVTMYREQEDEVIIGLDAASGATRWRHAYPAPLAHNGYVDIWLNASGPGPYSTPLLAYGGVFAVGIRLIRFGHAVFRINDEFFRPRYDRYGVSRLRESLPFRRVLRKRYVTS